VQVERATFSGTDGSSLSARLDAPDGPARAYALFAHCFTCGKDVFAASRIAQALVERGMAVLRFDLTGLGATKASLPTPRSLPTWLTWWQLPATCGATTRLRPCSSATAWAVPPYWRRRRRLPRCGPSRPSATPARASPTRAKVAGSGTALVVTVPVTNCTCRPVPYGSAVMKDPVSTTEYAPPALVNGVRGLTAS